MSEVQIVSSEAQLISMLKYYQQDEGRPIIFDNGFNNIPTMKQFESFKAGYHSKAMLGRMFTAMDAVNLIVINSDASVELNKLRARDEGGTEPNVAPFEHRTAFLAGTKNMLPPGLNILASFDEETPRPIIERIIASGVRLDAQIKYGYELDRISGSDLVVSQVDAEGNPKPGIVISITTSGFHPLGGSYYSQNHEKK